VTCSACGVELAAGSRFCNHCGAAQAASGRPAPDPRAYTPRHLAEKILRSRGALEGERKVVTVLFADLRRSLELASELDAEEWHRVLDGFFEILTEGVHRFEGTINQYTGDGIMALFGAPIAHEDHAQRACHAALELSERLQAYARALRRERGLELRVRMGLHSGPVVVGKIGDDLRMDYTAQGATVGLAQRVEELAEPGRVYLSEATAQLARGWFELEDLGDRELRGTGGRQRLFALRGLGPLRTRLDRSRSVGLSRFVGRDAELAQLEEARRRALREGGQLVAIVGEAGSGKSRLCFEFLERCRARGVAAYQASCVAHASDQPLVPMLELLRATFGVDSDPSPRASRERLARQLPPLDPEFAPDLPLLFEMLGVADPAEPEPVLDPAVRPHRVLVLLRRVLRHARGHTVLLLEDLHWIDSASREFLDHMIGVLPQSEILLLVNFRPGFEAPWRGLAHVREIALAPLPEAEIGELLRDLLGDDPSVAPLAQRIRAKTAGNPFFAEETVRDLAERGVLAGTRGDYRCEADHPSLEIPATVQSLLAARIDRLPDAEKRVLEAAAVIGDRIPAPLLARVAESGDAELGACLARLQRADLLQPFALEPELLYSFTHPLTREVAYETQLRDARRRMHAEVAKAIEALYADQLDARAGAIARHLRASGREREAADWYQRAARFVYRANPLEARQHWHEVLALLGDEPESAADREFAVEACLNILLLSLVSGIRADEAQSVYARARLYVDEQDFGRLAMLTSIYGLTVSATTGHLPTFVRLCEEATGYAERAGNPAVLASAGTTALTALYGMGRYAEVRTLADRILALEADPGVSALFKSADLLPLVRAQRARVEVLCGDPSLGLRELDQEIERADRAGAVTGQVMFRRYRAVFCEVLGDAARVASDAAEAVALADRTHAPLLRVQSRWVRGLACALAGDFAGAIEALEETHRVMQEARILLFDEAYLLGFLALAQAGAGLHDLARGTLAGALERARRLESPSALAEIRLDWARARLRERDRRHAREIARGHAEAESALHQLGVRFYDARIADARRALSELRRY
jgi:class 3 adenylate cyclase/tetratricopeptide (TPR) repeat protein